MIPSFFHKEPRGFTLIELLVVISIIALLSSIVLSSLSGARDKADTAAVEEEFHQIELSIDNVRDTKGEVMGLVTGNWYTDGQFSNASPANSQPAALQYNAAAWKTLGYAAPPVDPWGTPYSFDENELEGNNPHGIPAPPGGMNDCRYDALASAGPDRTFHTADDISYNVIHFWCNP